MCSNLIKEAYYEGLEAKQDFESGLVRAKKNPYEVHSISWHSWEKGWNDYFGGS
jgi:hypothetical protein